MKNGLAIVLGVVAAMQVGVGVARAQAIFIDRFDGTRLRPHWQQPPPEHWEYTVGGGQLTVTDLFHPGLPGEPNTASIVADFSSHIENYMVTAILAWDPGEDRELTVRCSGPFGIDVEFGYEERGGAAPTVFASGFGQLPARAPAPGPGTHEFRLIRDGDGILLLVDGQYSVGQVGASSVPISRVELTFSGADGVAFSPLGVGLVRIVPSPGAVLPLATGFVLVAAGRGRR